VSGLSDEEMMIFRGYLGLWILGKLYALGRIELEEFKLEYLQDEIYLWFNQRFRNCFKSLSNLFTELRVIIVYVLASEKSVSILLL